MGKPRSPNRDKSLEIYIKNSGNITPREIAEILGESASNISTWKNKDKWNDKLPPNKGGAPRGNLNSLKHGMYVNEAKRLPEEFLKKIVPTGLRNIHNYSKELDLNHMDYLKNLIDITWDRIMNSIKITHVKNKRDITKELKKEGWGDSGYNEYEIQFAWDKENASLDIFTKSVERLAKVIETYEKYTGQKYLLEIEEKKISIEKLKAETDRLNGKDNNDNNLANAVLEAMKKRNNKEGKD